MSPRILGFLLSLCITLAALMAHRHWPFETHSSAISAIVVPPLVKTPDVPLAKAKSSAVKNTNQPEQRPAGVRQATSEGEQWVAGSAATRLKAYMADFDGEDTAALEQRLADLEEEVAAADYFARANGGSLSFSETMAFDDLLKRQEAIHLILLQRKLATLGRLTAKL